MPKLIYRPPAHSSLTFSQLCISLQNHLLPVSFGADDIAPPPFSFSLSDSSLSFGRTCLTHRWLHPWILASWGRPAQLTADPHRAGLPTPPPPPPNGPRAWRGSSLSRHHDTRRPSWRARRQREAVLYLLLPFIHLSLSQEPVPQNPLTLNVETPRRRSLSRDGGVSIYPVAPADHHGTRNFV